MPGAYLYGWDAANTTWVKCLVNAEGKLIIDPTEIFENAPTNDEHGKAPDSDWAHDHAADVDAHHSKYTDAEAEAAINADADHGSTAPHNYFSGDHRDLSDVVADQHHAKYTDAEAETAINADADHGSTAPHNYFSGSHNDLTKINASDHHAKTGDNEVYGLILSNTIANRPAAGIAERYFFATDEGILYYDNGSSWVQITVAYVGGKVGIGMTSPGAKLDVLAGSAYRSVSASMLNLCGDNFIPQFGIESDEDGIQLKTMAKGGMLPSFTYDVFSLYMMGNNDGGSPADVAEILSNFEPSNRNGRLIFKTANNDTLAEAMRIDNNGNVGIGTTDPSAKLEVDGDIVCSGSITGNIPSGTKMLFKQNSAPSGWTFVSEDNDRVILNTNTESEGGNTGGGWTIIGLSHNISVDGHNLTTDEIPAHRHSVSGETGDFNQGTYANSVRSPTGGFNTGYTGGGYAHAHGVSGGISQDGSWRPAYAKVITCQKD